jgi:hypothetical protein
MRKYKIQPNYILAILFLAFVLYFFANNLHIIEDVLIKNPQSTIEKSIANKIDDANIKIKAINTAYSQNAHLKYSFINLNGFAHLAMGQRTMNDVIKLKNGYLATPREKATDLMQKNGEKTVKLYNDLKSKGIEFLWVQTPGKICEYDKQLPESFNDFSNENINSYLSVLKSNKVPYMDLREEIRKDGLDYYSCFYKTDHHWTLDTAFYAAGKITNVLNKNYRCNIDTYYFDKLNYLSIKYSDWFLGSLGKRVGNIYGSTDDVFVLLPNFSTNLTISLPYEKKILTGTFEDTIIHANQVETKEYFNLNPYAVYYGTDIPLTVQQNHNVSTNKKILIVKDSFMLPVCAFLSLGVSELDTMDLRKYTKESLVAYVEREHPDIVIFSLNPSILIDDQYFKRLGV